MRRTAAHIRKEVGTALTSLDEHKGNELVVLDLRAVSDATDYFLIASGTSDTHVRAVAENVVEALNARGVRPLTLSRHEGHLPHHVPEREDLHRQRFDRQHQLFRQCR